MQTSSSPPSKVLVLGGSKNIGYYSAVRLLESGATVTFMLRNTSVFDADETVQKYIKSGKARLVKGDGLVKDDVRNAWAEASKGDGGDVDLCIFTIGGVPSFKLTQGFVLNPPDLVTRSFKNTLCTLPEHRPRLIVISSTGLTPASHASLPLALKPLYSILLAGPHRDKLGVERLVAHCAGREWTDAPIDASVLPEGWERAEGLPAAGSYTRTVVVRPALLTDGECKADKNSAKGKDKEPYRVSLQEIGGYTISRRDVAHICVERVAKHWDEWEGKIASVAY